MQSTFELAYARLCEDFMFQRTFSFWRRLIGHNPKPVHEAGTAVEDERRLWLRYATDLQGQVQLPEGAPQEKILANVRDLSQGGANLIVGNAIPLGQMLTLDLPAGEGQVYSVLACVVRSAPEANGTWSLGCVFSRELTSDDLDRFGAQKRQADESDQRVWVRYECAVKASYRAFGDAADEATPVQVLNISATGIGLLVSKAFDTGALINVDLLDKTGRKVTAILACIVHTTEHPGGKHALGCNFI